jgi:hypothetical protein
VGRRVGVAVGSLAGESVSCWEGGLVGRRLGDSVNGTEGRNVVR